MQLLEIEILSDDLDKTKTFYTEILGLTISESTSTSISFQAGSSHLKFIQSDNKNPVYHFAFNLANNKFDEAIENLSKKSELIRNEDGNIITNFENWNARSIYFYDNNGNILEFITRFDLKNDTDKPYDSESILCISEIGIVTDKPHPFSERLVNKYNFPYFSKGPKNEHFVVLGDNEGLLIISSSIRNWFPTEVRVKNCYSKIAFMVNGKFETLINS